MKKLFFTALLSCFVLTAFAQKKVLKSANKEFRKENYEEAAKLAMEASEHPDTKDEPDVYLVLGQIEMKKFEASDKTSVENAEAAYNYFVTAMEKGDDKLRDKMMTPPVITQLPGQDELVQTGGSETMALLERWMLEGGNDALNMDEYARAYGFFSIAARINPSDELNFFTGYAAESAEMNDEMITYYTKVIESEADTLYENANFAYNGVIQHQLAAENFDEALTFIRAAKVAFPDNDLYPKWEVDVLISTDKLDEAVKGLESVIAGGGADSQTYTQLAFLHWKADDLDKAIEVCTEAVSMDGENYDANYVLGGAIYDQAANTLRQAGDSSIDDETYEKLKADAKARFSDAKPYFEKCLSIRPDDSALFAPLSTIYEQLGMTDKRDEMLAKMDMGEGN